MPKNLELKIHINSFYRLKNRLNKINAEFIGGLIQKDIYYKISNRLVKLRIENGQQSLIKYFRDEKGKDRWSDYDVIKFTEGDTEKFFNQLFDIDAVVKKKRLLYIYDNTRIHLDDVKKLGKFLELETLVLNGLKDAKKRFNKIINLLELDLSSQIKKSYKNLMIENINDFNKI
jgi:predicted adenylyl cyclase CyaB